MILFALTLLFVLEAFEGVVASEWFAEMFSSFKTLELLVIIEFNRLTYLLFATLFEGVSEPLLNRALLS